MDWYGGSHVRNFEQTNQIWTSCISGRQWSLLHLAFVFNFEKKRLPICVNTVCWTQSVDIWTSVFAVCYHTQKLYLSSTHSRMHSLPATAPCRNHVQKEIQGLITFMSFHVPCYMTHRGGGTRVPLGAGWKPHYFTAHCPKWNHCIKCLSLVKAGK